MDSQSLLAPLEEIARAAGQVQMRHFRNLQGIEKKGRNDLLTAADQESEDLIEQEILRRFPGHAILGEEGGKRGDPASETLWIVDPLDGTTNFAHGMRIFAVSIGVEHRGDLIAGCVYAPALEEMYLAAKGAGASCNGAPISVSPETELANSLIVTGFPYAREAMIGPLKEMVGAVLTHARGLLRLGAASLDFAMVASGRLDGFYELTLNPWDCAAGALLVTEAGGRVTGIDDSEFDLYGKQFLTSNGAIHEEFRRVVYTNGGRQALEIMRR